jgi:hypothetical protein
MICRVLASLVPVLGIACAGGAVAESKSPQQKQVYRWVDDRGQVHYGNAVPPEYARTDRERMNRQGVVVDKIQGDITEAEAREQAEAQRRLKEAAERRQRDNVLLQSYPSVAEIELVRDRRVELLDSQILVQRQYIGELEKKLTRLLVQSNNFAPRNRKPGAKPLPENLAEDIKRTGAGIRTANGNLQTTQSERQKLLDQFATDIQRFKELKGIKDLPPQATTTPPVTAKN